MRTTSVVMLACLAALLTPPPAHADRGAGTQRSPDPPRTVRGTLTALPAVVQPGTTPAAPPRAGSVVATFTPASAGRVVVLERRRRGEWRRVDRSVEDGWGSAAFATRPGTYRAMTTSNGRTWLTGAVRVRRWRTEFADDFGGTALDTSVWNDQQREHESVYAPRTCARVDGSVRRVADGLLHLGIGTDPARLNTPCSYSWEGEAGTSPYLLNSQVATEFTRSFRHGIVSARMRFQRARGMHAGFWMLPVGTTYADGDPSAGAEIDVVEFFGENGRDTETIASGVHHYEAGWDKVSQGGLFPEARRALDEDRSWWDEFHVFSVEWTPREYVFRVDGREYYRERRGVSQAQQYVVLSALTSDYELADLTPDELDDTAQVDWVRVFDATSRVSSRTTVGRRVAGARAR